MVLEFPSLVTQALLQDLRAGGYRQHAFRLPFNPGNNRLEHFGCLQLRLQLGQNEWLSDVDADCDATGARVPP